MTYLLRSIPKSLWRDVKRKAKKEDVTLRELLLRLLHDYVQG